MKESNQQDESLVRLSRRLGTLSLCTNMFFQAETEQDVLQSICDILAAGGDFRMAWIGYCENDAWKTVRPVARAGHGLDFLDRAHISWGDGETGQGPVGIALRTGKPCWINDISIDPGFSLWRTAATDNGHASCVALPLIAHSTRSGRVDLSGTLNLYSAECEFFDASTIEHYTALATNLTFTVAALRHTLAKELTSGVAALRTGWDRKSAQNALQTMREELAHVRRVTEMGQMAASIAHEISQPLSAIVANADAGLLWLVRESPDVDEVQAALQSIIHDAHRASDLIKSIRAMFQRDGQERIPCDINELIREVLALVDGEIRRQRVSVETELIEELPYVSANRTQLQQVIVNLMTNAVEAMGSVTDRARVLRVKSSLHESDGLLISVEDSGTGIDPKDMHRIFDAFFTTKATGMGMGLAICRSIIEAHGGRLWALAASPHGSIFQVAIPKN